jgi:thiol-disulfide isomerase/thioredoxin
MHKLIRLLTVAWLSWTLTAAQALAFEPRPLPEFSNANPAEWFNSPPLKTTYLRGKVVLVDVWTYGCWNCYRSFPWLNAMEKRLADEDFTVIGIHSPEFEHEHEPARVEDKIREFKLHHPVMMDNDFAYWRALENRYWPAYYLVDKQGVIRHLHVGETHEGQARAVRIEEQIRALLAEE